MPKKPKQDEALDGRLLLEFLAENFAVVVFGDKKLIVALENDEYEYTVLSTERVKKLYSGNSMEKATKALNG